MHRGDSPDGAVEIFPPAAIETQLELILASPPFHKSARMCRFLRFIVGESLRGRADSLKEYSIGVEVFDKGTDFDPRTDNNVRTEARRLRAKLAEYYDTIGKSDVVRIELPRGSYAPLFLAQTAAAESPPGPPPLPPHRRSRWLPFAAGMVCMSLVSAGVLWRGLGPSRPAKLRSIAVLPFSNPGSSNDEALADGLVEDILNHLARVPGIKVVARTSSFQFKDSKDNVRTIGKRLNVDSVLQGSVIRMGTRLHINAQLIATADGSALWSETFDRDGDGWYALEAEIATPVARALGAPSAGTAAQPPRNPEAYLLCTRARYHWNKWDPKEFRSSLALYEQAIRLDPGYAPAYAGLAAAQGVLGSWGAEPSAQAAEKSRAAAQRAIELDPNLAEGYVVLANIKTIWDHDWEGAGRDFQRALSLNPGAASLRRDYAMHYLAPQNRLQDAMREERQAAELDPVSLRVAADVGWLLYFRRDYDAAISQLRQTLELEPTFAVASMFLFKCFMLKGMFPEARAIIEPPQKSPYPEEFPLHMGRIQARSGNQSEARKLLQRYLDGCSPHCPEARMQIVWLQIEVGDLDAAFGSLEKAYEERNNGMLMLQVDPVFDPIRADPRYHALLVKMRLAR